MIKKNIPNAITCIRILFAFMILFVEIRTINFILLYTFCIVSDLLDGYLARKFDCANKFGSILDSTADFIFLFVMMIRFIPMIDGPNWIFTWMGFIFILRLVSLFIAGCRYHTFVFLHTYLNKGTGFLIAMCPLLILILNIEQLALIICSIASLATIEELLINGTSKSLERNVKSIKQMN